MVTVKRKPDDSNDNMINRFRKKILDSGLVIEIKDRDRHTKKSQKRKEEKKERQRLIKQKERKNKR